MSNEFYRAIAKRLVKFLRGQNIGKGSRFWLRLDSQDMVDGISEEVYKVISQSGDLGHYAYLNESGVQTFETYTLELPTVRVVFAYQTLEMTTDFLAALRNDAREKGHAIVSLTTEKSDTVDSATRLLSDTGMPFNEESLKQDIRSIITGSSFSPGIRALLDFALRHMEEDRFSDKSSVSGYETFLSIVERTKVIDEDFLAFRMFPDQEALDLCPRANDKKTTERFTENVDLYEAIDKAFSRDEIKDKLGDVYKQEFVKSLQEKKTRDDDWRIGLTYKLVKDSKKKSPNDKTVELSEDVVRAEYHQIDDPMSYTAEIYMKAEGETKAKRRKRHILAFVPKDATDLVLEFKTTSPVQKAHLDDKIDKRVNIERTQTRVVITIKLDENTTIIPTIKIQKNALSIAVVHAREKYFSGIQTRYSIDTRKSSASILVDVEEGEFCLNPSGTEVKRDNVLVGESYSCFDDTRLELCVNEEALDDAPSNILFSVSCDDCLIPISVKHDVRSIRALNAIDIYREKLISKRSFKRLESGRIQLGSYEYTIDDPIMARYLSIEERLIKDQLLSAVYVDGSLTGRSLNLPNRLKNAYDELIALLQKEGVEPSLAFVGDRRFVAAYTECVEAYSEAIFNIAEGDFDFESLLEIGVVFDAHNEKIWFTPLHPLNIAYQLNLLGAGEIVRDDSLVDVALARLVHPQAVPFVFHADRYYEASDITETPEWTIYYEHESLQSRARGDRVSRIVRERIEDFLNHFGFLFADAAHKPLRIACYQLGTCEDVLVGIAEYLFSQLVKEEQEPDKIINIHVDCYGDPSIYTAFENLLDKGTLTAFLKEKGLLRKDLVSVGESECLTTLLSHLSFSLHNLEDERAYSHIAFVPGASRTNPRPDGNPSEMRTGIMLEGAICVASTTDSQGWFSTAFGVKHMAENDFSKLLLKVNSLHASAYSQKGASNTVITAAISHDEEKEYDTIYQSSNWVVLLDPKVDPMHFVKEGAGSEHPLVIHYEDREASNGYDAITVTKKTSQYEGVIAEALTGASHGDVSENVRDIVDFANAFNGTWLLSFLESKRTYTPRSRMSMLAAVKAGMAHYSSDDIVWVPLSLEEMLRVSTGLKLSTASEINSWKNLEFDTQPTSDDVLLVGITGQADHPEIILHPIEVKVGNCTETEVNKGVKQAISTYSGFMRSYWAEERRYRLSTRIARNAFMQKVLISAEKMEAYGVFPDTKWSWVLEDCREALQNEHYDIVDSGQYNMPNGTVCAFAKDAVHFDIETKETVRILRLPETHIPDITVGS